MRCRGTLPIPCASTNAVVPSEGMVGDDATARKSEKPGDNSIINEIGSKTDIHIYI